MCIIKLNKMKFMKTYNNNLSKHRFYLVSCMLRFHDFFSNKASNIKIVLFLFYAKFLNAENE